MMKCSGIYKQGLRDELHVLQYLHSHGMFCTVPAHSLVCSAQYLHSHWYVLLLGVGVVLVDVQHDDGVGEREAGVSAGQRLAVTFLKHSVGQRCDGGDNVEVVPVPTCTCRVAGSGTYGYLLASARRNLPGCS